MDEKSRQEMDGLYSALADKYGDSLEALKYRKPDHQEKRFALMAAIEPIAKEASVLDIGCGLGHFCDFLRKYGWQGKYTGIDVSAGMVATAAKRLPDGNLVCRDILNDDFKEEHDYVFCGATIQIKPAYAEPLRYLKQMVAKMFSLSKKGLAFDVFSGRVDYQDEDKLYICPKDLLDFCYSLTGRVTLRNDARPYEVMAYLYKEQDKDEFNVYNSWISSEPKII